MYPGIKSWNDGNSGVSKQSPLMNPECIGQGAVGGADEAIDLIGIEDHDGTMVAVLQRKLIAANAAVNGSFHARCGLGYRLG
jgi:hypothetical protein